MGNEFANMHENKDYETHAFWAVDILNHCALVDPQGERLHYIVREFRRDIAARKEKLAKAQYLIGPFMQPTSDLGDIDALEMIPSVRWEVGLRPKRGDAILAKTRLIASDSLRASLPTAHHPLANAHSPESISSSVAPKDAGTLAPTRVDGSRRFSLPPLRMAFPNPHAREHDGNSLCSSSSGDVEFEQADGIFVQARH